MKTPNHCTDAELAALFGDLKHESTRAAIACTLKEHMRESARAYLLALLAQHRRRGDAARIAGVNRTHLYELCRRYGIDLECRSHRGSWGDL